MSIHIGSSSWMASRQSFDCMSDYQYTFLLHFHSTLHNTMALSPAICSAVQPQCIFGICNHSIGYIICAMKCPKLIVRFSCCAYHYYLCNHCVSWQMSLVTPTVIQHSVLFYAIVNYFTITIGGFLLWAPRYIFCRVEWRGCGLAKSSCDLWIDLNDLTWVIFSTPDLSGLDDTFIVITLFYK